MLGQNARRTFPPLITAAKWSSAWQSTFNSAKRRRGTTATPEGGEVPRLTNGDAVSLIQSWARAGAGKFWLWAQFAAIAYAWRAGLGLVTSEKQRGSMFDAGLLRDLWAQTKLAAKEMDADNGLSARLEFEDDAFANPVFQGQVLASLKQDGDATAQGKIAYGCKDPRTGKVVGPKMKCREGFTLELVKGTPFYVCRNRKTGETEQPTIECEGEKAYIDDPITALLKSTGRLALILGFAYVVITSMGDD